MSALTNGSWGKVPSHFPNVCIFPREKKKVTLAQRGSLSAKPNSMKYFKAPQFSDRKHIPLESSQPALFKTVLAVIAHSLIQLSKIEFKPS